jgi:hypothetical protein
MALDLAVRQPWAAGRGRAQAHVVQGQCRQALAERALVARVDVVGIAHIQGHRHAGVRQLQRLGLCVAQLGPAAFAGAVVLQRQVGRQLHEEERQLRLLELRAPVLDQALEAARVRRRAAGVALALVPEHAAQAQALQRRDEAVVGQRGRIVRGGLGGHARLGHAGAPGAGQRHGAGGRVQPHGRRVAMEAAATTGVGDAHGDPVRTGAQQPGRDRVAARLVMAALAAHALAVDPDLVAVVHLRQVQAGRAGCLRGAQLDAPAHPDDAIEVRQPLALPHAGRLQRGPAGIDVVAGFRPAAGVRVLPR